MFEVLWAMFCAIGKMLWELAPTIMEILKIKSYFTPAGIIALQIGVPTFVITASIFLLKKAVFDR